MYELCCLDGVCALTLTVGVAIVFLFMYGCMEKNGYRGDMQGKRGMFNSVSPNVAPCDATLRYVWPCPQSTST